MERDTYDILSYLCKRRQTSPRATLTMPALGHSP
jgi:hypothetical protein